MRAEGRTALNVNMLSVTHCSHVPSFPASLPLCHPPSAGSCGKRKKKKKKKGEKEGKGAGWAGDRYQVMLMFFEAEKK